MGYTPKQIHVNKKYDNMPPSPKATSLPQLSLKKIVQTSAIVLSSWDPLICNKSTNNHAATVSKTESRHHSVEMILIF